MKSRIIWGAVLLAAFVAFYVVTIRPTLTPVKFQSDEPTANRTPAEKRERFPVPAELTSAGISRPPVANAPLVMVRVEPPPLKMEVPIQNGATIDFSVGAPMIRSGGEDGDALERALKEMAEATKDTKFPPTK
jgi:hypothetical protein